MDLTALEAAPGTGCPDVHMYTSTAGCAGLWAASPSMTMTSEVDVAPSPLHDVPILMLCYLQSSSSPDPCSPGLRKALLPGKLNPFPCPHLSPTHATTKQARIRARNKPPGAWPPSTSPEVPGGAVWVPPSASGLPQWPTMLCVCCVPCSCARLCCWRAALGWARPALWEQLRVLQVGLIPGHDGGSLRSERWLQDAQGCWLMCMACLLIALL